MDWNHVREQNEARKRKYGPSPNPDSERQKLFAARELSRRTKEERDASTAGCTWETSTRGGMRDNEGPVCCANWQCSTQYSSLVVGRLRKHYSGLTPEGRRAFLSQRSPVGGICDRSRPIQGQKVYEACLEAPLVLDEKLARMSTHGGELGALRAADAQPVCRRWLTFATGGCNDTTYTQRRRAALGPDMTPEHLDLSQPLPARKPQTKSRDTTGADLAIKWLLEQAEMSCILPSHNQIVLPWRTKSTTHANYIKDMEAHLGVPWAGQQVKVGCDKRKKASLFRYGNYLLGEVGSLPVSANLVGRANFNKTWAGCDALRDVVVRHWMPFAKCTQCTQFRELETSHRKKDRTQRDAAQAKQRRHIANVKLERRHYHSNRLRAILEPATYMSLIIDGADQGKHLLPHFCNRSHLSDEAVKQHLYAYGAISHGRKAYTFLLPGHVAQGHDVTIEVLWRVINDVLSEEGKVPPVLLLQLDNTTKQNKGRFLFAFLALLVHHNVFDKILVSFLPVGHTHEDIDQMFSRFAEYLRGHNARSRAEMADAMRRAFAYGDQLAQVHILQTVAAMSDFLAAGTGIELPECMSHRHFRIRRDEKGRTIIQGRSTPIVSYITEPWLGLEGNSSYHDIFPSFIPNLVVGMEKGLVPAARRPGKPASSELVKKMRAGLTKMREGMPLELFEDAHYTDCLAMTDLYEAPMAGFQWDPVRVRHFFSGAPKPDQDAAGDRDESDADLCFQVKVMHYYIVRPSDDDETGSPFWIAEVAKRGRPQFVRLQTRSSLFVFVRSERDIFSKRHHALDDSRKIV